MCFLQPGTGAQGEGALSQSPNKEWCATQATAGVVITKRLTEKTDLFQGINGYWTNSWMQYIRASRPSKDAYGRYSLVKCTHRIPERFISQDHPQGQEHSGNIYGPRSANKKKFSITGFTWYTEKGTKSWRQPCGRARTKRRWQEDWSNQITAIHIQKASLHLTTHIPCAPRCSPLYLSGCCTSHPP